MPVKSRYKMMGDLHVKCKVALPKTLNAQQMEMIGTTLKEWINWNSFDNIYIPSNLFKMYLNL